MHLDVKICVGLDSESPFLIGRIVPDRSPEVSQLVGVYEGMIEVGTIVQCFVDDQNVLSAVAVGITSSNRDNWNTNLGVIFIPVSQNITNTLGIIQKCAIFPCDESICMTVQLEPTMLPYLVRLAPKGLRYSVHISHGRFDLFYLQLAEFCASRTHNNRKIILNVNPILFNAVSTLGHTFFRAICIFNHHTVFRAIYIFNHKQKGGIIC